MVTKEDGLMMNRDNISALVMVISVVVLSVTLVLQYTSTILALIRLGQYSSKNNNNNKKTKAW